MSLLVVGSIAFDSIETRLQVARTRVALAEVRHARGDVDGAAAELRTANKMFTTLGLPRWKERIEALAKDLGVGLD